MKKATLKYEDANQVARYRDELRRLGHKNVWMWLVAPHIPNSVREYLDDKAIEYTEIHEAQFKRVAEQRGVTLLEEVLPAAPIAVAGTPRTPNRSSAVSWTESPYPLKQDLDKSQVEQLIVRFESAVRRQIDRSLSQKLRQELLGDHAPYISRATTRQLAKWCDTKNPVYRNGMDVARQLSQLLFGCVLDRQKLGI